MVVAEAAGGWSLLTSDLPSTRPVLSCWRYSKAHDFVGTRVIVLRCIGTAGWDVALNTDSAIWRSRGLGAQLL